MIYQTTVYLVAEFAGSTITDQFSIPLTRLHRNEIEDLDEKSAAAKAWIEAVGQFRREKLEILGAPELIKDAEGSQSFVAGKLKSFPLCLNAEWTFVFDNMAEAWLISVDGPNSIFLDQ